MHTAASQRPSSGSTADLLGGFGLKLLDNIKSALGSDQQPPIAAVVSALMENRANAETDDYVYLDPRSAKRGSTRAAPGTTRRAFQSAVVVMIGGGTYLEHLHLQNYARVRVPAAPHPASPPRAPPPFCWAGSPEPLMRTGRTHTPLARTRTDATLAQEHHVWRDRAHQPAAVSAAARGAG